jgi:hypothetical protein
MTPWALAIPLIALGLAFGGLYIELRELREMVKLLQATVAADRADRVARQRPAKL